VALDQLRTVDRERLLKRLGRLTPVTVTAVCAGMQEMFARMTQADAFAIILMELYNCHHDQDAGSAAG
jgi:hypothetical protein